ncbi:MAG: hypothetical protein QOF56_2508 [Acidobacteriaceae bacterium]|jgi:hypothetical protein|nr:hypothetical protein [Acidobacteriaceae bacterium]
MADSFSNPSPQFGTAEYLGKQGSDHCQFCHQPIAGNYYRINNAMACGGCAEKMRGALATDTHVAYVRALVFGVFAAIAGMILYAVFEIATGLIIGYVSLAVGWMVGTAMMKGSKGVGGRRYQITAVVLTYAAVSMAAVPVWIHYGNKERQEQQQRQRNQGQPTQQQLEDEQRQLESESGQQPSLAAAKPVQPRMSIGRWLGRVVLIGLASPFLEVWGGGVSWLIGLVILFVGMKIAAKLTGGRPLEIYGPFNDSPQLSR